MKPIITLTKTDSGVDLKVQGTANDLIMIIAASYKANTAFKTLIDEGIHTALKKGVMVAGSKPNANELVVFIDGEADKGVNPSPL